MAVKEVVRDTENNKTITNDGGKSAFLDKPGKIADKKDVKLIQPSMLPPFFRQRSRFLQKFYVLTAVIIAAIAVGAVCFTLLDDLTQRYFLESDQKTFFITMTIMIIVLMATALWVNYWTRSRSYIITFSEFIGYLMPSIIVLVAYALLDNGVLVSTTGSTNEKINMLFEQLGIIALAVTGWTFIHVLFTSLFKLRTYKQVSYRFLWTGFGLLVAGVGPLILWILGKDKVEKNLDIVTLIIPYIVFFIGIFFIAIGFIFSSRFKVSESKGATNSAIKSTGTLPSIVVSFVLITVGFKYITGLTGGIWPLLVVAGADLLILISFLAFLFFKSRIRNLFKSNPLLNEFIVKSSILASAFIGLIFVAVLESIIELRSYSYLAFSIVGVSALTVGLIVIASHFGNLITFSRFFKSIVGVALLLVLVAVVIVSVVSTTDDTNLVVHLAARWLSIFLIALLLTAELVSMIINIAYIYGEILLIGGNNKEKKTKKEFGRIKEGLTSGPEEQDLKEKDLVPGMAPR